MNAVLTTICDIMKVAISLPVDININQFLRKSLIRISSTSNYICNWDYDHSNNSNFYQRHCILIQLSNRVVDYKCDSDTSCRILHSERILSAFPILLTKWRMPNVTQTEKDLHQPEIWPDLPENCQTPKSSKNFGHSPVKSL